ncbi:MAG: hypothetical protein AAF682_24535 [Planctomycetota bacterium]
MSRPPRAWVLNLDAEHELEARGSYAPTRAMRAIVERESQRLLDELVAPGDVVLSGDQATGGDARGLVGMAWSPTPRALARLERAGALVQAAPDTSALRAVNARPFAVGVRAPLVAASFDKSVAATLDEALALLARPAPDGWLARRSFGAAGRGRRRIESGCRDATDRAWLAASLRLGPLVVEPWVRVTREYTRSGWVHADGAIEVARPCFQRVTRAGAWTATAPAARGEVVRDDDARLAAAAEAAGIALAQAGYFGPFGIDAFRHRVPGATREVLNPLSEINARFTMDWTTGLGERAEPLVEAVAPAAPESRATGAID